MEKEVVISEPGAPSTSLSSSRIICRVCQKQFSQYTCPRCNTQYCSLQCYKRHNLRCTESFMRENVMEELQQTQPEDETKKKMLDILKRFHFEDQEQMDSDDEDEPMLQEELIQKVLSGDEIRLDDLSPNEIKRFKKALATGELSKLIEPWTPWWTKSSAKSISLGQKGSQLITQLNNGSNTEPVINEIPPGPETPLLPLRQLTRSDPSPLLTVHLVDVLYSYCFTLRLYNGDWGSDPFGAVTAFFAVSKVMGEESRPETVREALGFCLEKVCSPVYRHTGGLGFAIGLVEDVISLLSLGGDVIVCALCDLRRMVQAGEKLVKCERVGRGERVRLRGVERKLYFMMCWVREQQEEVWSGLSGLVQVEKASLSKSGPSSRPVKGERKSVPKSCTQSKVLIEEV